MASQEDMLAAQKAQCPFCKIAAKEFDSHIVYEDDLFMGVLDINPAAKGHVLFFPKEHYPIMATMPSEVFTKMSIAVKKLAKKVQAAMMSQGTEIYIASGQAAGQPVFHVTIHIIPREEGDGLTNFHLPTKTMDPSQLKKTKELLTANLTKIMTGKFQTAEPMNTEKVLAMIEQNEQLKTIIIEKPDHFRELAKKHPQMQQMFKNIDVEEIIAAVTGKAAERKPENKEGKKKEKEEESEKKTEKKDEKKEKKEETSLDDVGSYLKKL